MKEIKVKNILGEYITLTVEEVEFLLKENLMLTRKASDMRKKIDMFKAKVNNILVHTWED